MGWYVHVTVLILIKLHMKSKVNYYLERGESQMAKYEYALINKDTLRFIRNTKQVSYAYVERIAKFKSDKISAWEDSSSDKLPTINQAKALAKCYRVPFAGFYMDYEDINVKHLPAIINRRTIFGAVSDDSAVNLALIDLLNDRDFYLDTKDHFKEPTPKFNFEPAGKKPSEWAQEIRDYFELSLSKQYRTNSKRQFYLYLRDKIESKGVFIQGFRRVDISELRGVAICDNLMPIIGINENDRPPAKSFTIIHELVHIIKRTSSICNDIYSSPDNEEVFCNAVAGETLVPKVALLQNLKSYSCPLDIEAVDSLANKFSVSSEVIARRLLDIGKCDRAWYLSISKELSYRIIHEREERRIARQMGISSSIPRNMPREAVDRTSADMCRVLLRGYSENLFDKADISAHIGIREKHIDKFMAEVLAWR